jgi:Ras-related protein Rab-27A
MGFLLVFDVTNESTFLSIRNWLTYIDNFTSIDNNPRPPVLLIGNKIDLVTERTIDTIRAQQLANELGITYMETSAVTGTNVPDALRIIIEKITHFMNESMERYYPKQCLQLSTDNNYHRRKSINLINKLPTIKTNSCTCT